MYRERRKKKKSFLVHYARLSVSRQVKKFSSVLDDHILLHCPGISLSVNAWKKSICPISMDSMIVISPGERTKEALSNLLCLSIQWQQLLLVLSSFISNRTSDVGFSITHRLMCSSYCLTDSRTSERLLNERGIGGEEEEEKTFRGLVLKTRSLACCFGMI